MASTTKIGWVKIESGAKIGSQDIDTDDDDGNDDDVMEIDESKMPIRKQKGKRSRRCFSTVWNHFERIVENDKRRTAKCKGCGKTYKADGTYGTVRNVLYGLYYEYEISSNMENACGSTGENSMSKHN
ncbi:uncharacterized protein [Euphorbia lathyris]|uniref:uncharacterized protein n=1 Tax=Euphorbia lathyris TaxID=212925 RepID=UPI003313335C